MHFNKWTDNCHTHSYLIIHRVNCFEPFNQNRKSNIKYLAKYYFSRIMKSILTSINLIFRALNHMVGGIK